MAIKCVEAVSRNGKRYHKYYIDGVYAPGVTSILSKALPKPALAPWAAKSVAEYVAANADAVTEMWGWPLNGKGQPERMVNELKGTPYRQRDEAADRGTEVHALAEHLVHGREVEVPEPLAGHVDSYVRFLDEWQPRPVLVEGVVASRRWHYAGRLDLVADLPNGQRALMDLKTSRGVYPEVALQIAGYRFAEVYVDKDGVEQSMADLGINAAYVVHCRADGYDCRPVDAGEDQFKVFQHLAWLARRIDEMKPWLGEPAAVPAEVSA